MNPNIESSLSRLAFLPPLLARATLAVAFGVSAKWKFAHIKDSTQQFRELGVPAPAVMAPFVAATEATCAALLAAGYLTRLAAIPLIPVMGVAILTARRKDFQSFSDLTGVYEFNYILLLSYLITQGPGGVSLDSLLQTLKSQAGPGDTLLQAA